MENQNQTVQLNLTIDQVNKIMSALGNLPYVQVCQLIDQIQKQVGAQLTPDIEKIVNQPEKVEK